MSEPDVPIPSAPRGFPQRVIGALLLDASVYEEVEHDESAIGQAATVVALGAAASGVGALSAVGLSGVVGAFIAAFVGWVIAAAMVFLVGVKLMDHSSDFPELLRTLGFASAPQILTVVAIIPILGTIANLIAFVLGLIAYVIAVRQALDTSTGKAILVCLLAVLTQMAIVVALSLLGMGALAGASALS